MDDAAQLMLLYLIALAIIIMLLYLALRVTKKVKVVSPKHASFETHWWGYGWRPWWRRYNGVPGVM